MAILHTLGTWSRRMGSPAEEQIVDLLILLHNNLILAAIISSVQATWPILMLAANLLDYLLFNTGKHMRSGHFFFNFLVRTSHGAVGMYESANDWRSALITNESERRALMEQQRSVRIRLFAALFVVWLRVLAGGNKAALVYFHLY
ncbi:hypothetical protein THASP1DRAFT_32899 [Thamnocephalis sphaerospora]|uniref:Uncharacterized protein n=1 Tax=Thamnocephalis sphaerospora TaxID=78915 RepID=A0A4P9XIS2_9FUNG|nr:hypothetical protein THASP1DRAFT_32899 [Thamnocephalis sphaerospora]|eukprot:RKP05261.1 hypothetical protein THASP1DRAFT_32899 [Thamnocephalis sphaerospora]